jgi:hypothetical protein
MMESFYNKLIYRFENLLSHKYWYLFVTAITIAAIFFFTSPSYYTLTKDFKPCEGCVSFQEEINRADYILHPIKYPEASHMANTQFRITIPLIAKLCGTRSVLVIFVIQEILGIWFFILTCLLSYRLTKDKVTAAIVTLSLGFIYAGKAAFVDIQGMTDSFAYFFLVLALYTRIKPLIVLSLLLSYFTDERALISSSLIGIFYFLEYLEITKGKIDIYQFIKAGVFYVLLSWILYFTIRFTLFKLYGLHNPVAGIDPPNVHQLGYVFWDGLQGFWLLLFFGIIYLVIEKRFFIIALLILSFLAVAISASMVYDLTRSIAYIFPMIFVSLFLIHKALNTAQLRKIVILSCLICFVCGDSYFGLSAPPDYYRSVPIKVIEKAFLHKH